MRSGRRQLCQVTEALAINKYVLYFLINSLKISQQTNMYPRGSPRARSLTRPYFCNSRRPPPGPVYIGSGRETLRAAQREAQLLATRPNVSAEVHAAHVPPDRREMIKNKVCGHGLDVNSVCHNKLRAEAHSRICGRSALNSR
jgi:hypothetical protein